MRSRPNSWLSTLTQLGFTRKKNKAKQRGKHRSLRVESLEDRRLLAVVMNTNDSGSGSLRQEIIDATPGDTITFDPSLNDATIDLDSELLVGKNLTIDASSLGDGITLNAGNGIDGVFGTADGHRIFRIGTADVTLRGLTMTGGDVSDRNFVLFGDARVGGAIFNDGGNLTLEQSKITGNAAVDNFDGGNTFDQALAYGGAIFSYGGSVNVLDKSTLSGNLASVDVSNNTIDGVRSIASGGGISTKDADLFIENSDITGNAALADVTGLVTTSRGIGSQVYGGGIHARGQNNELQILKSTIANNSVVSVINEFASVSDADGNILASGGGIDADNVEFFLEESTVNNNASSSVGAINQDDTVLDSIAVGGGISLRSNDGIGIINSTISGNRVLIDHPKFVGGSQGSMAYGGGLYVEGAKYEPAAIRHSTITNNHVNNDNMIAMFPANNHAAGGGIFSAGNTLASNPLVIDHTIVAGNMVDGGDNNVESKTGSFVTESNSYTSGNPGLGQLQDNGGPTFTHKPNIGSPAIDAGDPNFMPPPTEDQRGFDRVHDGDTLDMIAQIDIGAVEFGSGPICDPDFDGDGDVDGVDFFIWQGNFGMDGATQMQGDANGDGLVDAADLAKWESLFGTGAVTPITGDFNLDFTVDMDDLTLLMDGLAAGITTGATLGDGDANDDGKVDASDYVAWQVKYGRGISSLDWLQSALSIDATALNSGEIIVTSLTDDLDSDYGVSDLSLREALAIADSTTGPDTITFATNVHGTIELTQGELDIETDVDIVGPGSDRLTIDAQSNSRGFNISDGVSTNLLDVSISGLTITDGYIAGSGAGIENDENLELTNVVLTDNVATNLGGCD